MKVIKNLSLLSFCFILLVLSSCAAGQKEKVTNQPKLVVGIVVDQMRWDYLYRLSDRYGDTGFKRMLKEGFSFENCMLSHVPTFTAIGHSTIYTGSVPAIHGIAGNDFVEQSTGRIVYCTEDQRVKTVGNDNPEDKAGKHSPFNLKVTTMCDQLKYATNFRSKVVGVALKDRASILPAGHAADAAYWFDGKSGKWITSSFYMDKLPKWLEDYNALNMPAQYLAKDWNPSYPIETYIHSPEMSLLGRYEGGYKDCGPVTFPMKTSEMVGTLGAGSLVQTTPYGNDITIDVAKLVIENENLGNNKYGVTDFLAVSFSSPDKMAHQFSINSILTEDAYIKLDQQIGEFLSYLDSKVGKGNYLLFLSADHAATPNAQFMEDHKMPGGHWEYSGIGGKLNDYLSTIYKRNDLIHSVLNYKVNFNYPVIKEARINLEELKLKCIDYINQQEGVLFALDIKKISEAPIPEVIKEKIANGYNRENSGEIEIVLKAGWYEYGFPEKNKGGTHGVWTPDDSHIPFVLMGWNITHGRSTREVYMTDIAPTISAMLRIQMPSGCIGKSIYGD